MRFKALALVPGAGHVHVSARELAPVVRAALDELPQLRAKLQRAPRWEAFVVVASCLGSILKHPVAIVGGCHDGDADPNRASGNGWGQLIGAVLGTDAQRGRTAATHWARLHEVHAGVRIPEYDRAPGSTSRPWKAPERRRCDGGKRKSGGRWYRRKLIAGTAYFSSWALVHLYAHPELQPLRAALAKLVDGQHRWRAHARFLSGAGGRVGYWHRIKRSRQASREYREKQEKARKRADSRPEWLKRKIRASSSGRKRIQQKGRGLSPPVNSGGGPRAGAPPGAPAVHGNSALRLSRGSPHALPCPATRPEPARQATNDLDVGSMSPADAQAFLRALLGD